MTEVPPHLFEDYESVPFSEITMLRERSKALAKLEPTFRRVSRALVYMTMENRELKTQLGIAPTIGNENVSVVQ